MKNKILTGSLMIALPLFSAIAQEGEVIDRDAKIIDRQGAELESQREVDTGSKEVEYKQQRQVTETVKKTADLPTFQVCETKANINEMEAEDFQALGFDQNAAKSIVKQREQRGAFASVDELGQISGIQQDTLNQVKADLGVAPKQAQEE